MDHCSVSVRSNLSIDTDAQVLPLPSVALGPVGPALGEVFSRASAANCSGRVGVLRESEFNQFYATHRSFWLSKPNSTIAMFGMPAMRSNPSIERTLSGLRPPSASHVKR